MSDRNDALRDTANKIIEDFLSDGVEFSDVADAVWEYNPEFVDDSPFMRDVYYRVKEELDIAFTLWEEHQQ